MTHSSNIKYLKLEGTPRERGQARGEELKAMIWEHLERYKYFIPSFLSPGLPPDAKIENFIKDTKHVAAAEKWTPHLLEEVRGIGEGSGIGFNNAFMLSATEEMWRWDESAGASAQCTSLGCGPDGDTPALMGQNLDTIIHAKNTEVLLHIEEPDGRQKFVVTEAGHLGVMGLSNAPLGILVNTVFLNSTPDGLPVPFVAMGMLDQPTVDDAVSFLKSVKVGASLNYMIGDAKKVVDYETSAKGAVQFEPCKGAKRVYHTNHPLASDDFIPGYPTIAQESIKRLSYLKYRLDDPEKPIAIDNIKGILRSHLGPICHHSEGGVMSIATTWVSLVYSMGENPELHVTAGNPCDNKYQVFSFD